MNEDEGADVDVLASKVDTNRTRQKIRRDPAKKLKEPKKIKKNTKNIKKLKNIKTLASHFSFTFIVSAHENS